MAKLQCNGLEEYALRLSKLENESEEIAKKAVYSGAEIIADAIKTGLKQLPIQEGVNNFPPYGDSNTQITGVSRRQKGDLIDSFGLAPIQEFEKGYLSTKAGWDGYGSMPTRNYPRGVPNQMLMRSIESGTSFRKKNPIVRKAVISNKKKAIEAMGKEIDKACEEVMK